jgi:hypothetical protein
MYLTEKLAATDTEAKANGSSESSSKDSKSVLKRSTSPNREEGPWKKAKNVYGRYLVLLLPTNGNRYQSSFPLNCKNIFKSFY